jgi:hypothetical protein
MYKSHDERKLREQELKGGASKLAKAIRDKRERELREVRD